jgi:4-oxalmesaconate hydratase
MIIDCHGHYTTAPKPLQDYRESQIAGLKNPDNVPAKGTVQISDDQIRESLEGAQLKFQRERGPTSRSFRLAHRRWPTTSEMKRSAVIGPNTATT